LIKPSALLLLFATLIGTSQGQDSGYGVTASYGSGMSGPLAFYQKYISPVKGRHLCSMYPSCSQYAKQAFANTGAFNAWFGTVDRLLRCGQDTHHYSLKLVNGRYLYYDPLPAVTDMDTLILKVNDQVTDQSFADRLYHSGQFDLALLEYQRQLFHEERLHIAQPLRYKMALCHYQNEAYDKVREVYDTLMTEGVDSDSLFYRVSVLQVKAFVAQKDHKNANAILMTLVNDSREESKLLHGLVQLADSRFGEASITFGSVPGVKQNPLTFEALTSLEQDYENLNRKSIWTAALSSAVLPGAGYAYAGRKGTALMALLINGLFIWTSVEAFNAGRYALFTTTGILGLGWYIGTIRGSAEAALNYNRKKKEEFIQSRIHLINTLL